MGSDFLNKKAQGSFCRVVLTAKNVTKKAKLFHADGTVSALDATGREYEADGEAAIYGNEDGEGFLDEINPGNAVKANVYFDVPKGTKLVKLVFDAGLFTLAEDAEVTLGAAAPPRRCQSASRRRSVSSVPFAVRVTSISPSARISASPRPRKLDPLDLRQRPLSRMVAVTVRSAIVTRPRSSGPPGRPGARSRSPPPRDRHGQVEQVGLADVVGEEEVLQPLAEHAEPGRVGGQTQREPVQLGRPARAPPRRRAGTARPPGPRRRRPGPPRAARAVASARNWPSPASMPADRSSIRPSV
ncbi:DUF4352 domain-containing protein [Micromonospora sp. BRA006-A]|nr:DUF4352 domain-containing protein [Micromonospora sp. BRA006-A]